VIQEYEISKSSKLYFGRSANLKRKIENISSDFLLDNNFQELVTPNFSFYNPQDIEDERGLIKTVNENNESIALRGDTTLDVVRLIKRLEKSTNNKKWFYIQPIFKYPAKEFYQIGVEWIDTDNITDTLVTLTSILNKLGLDSCLQIANIRIPQIISKEFNIDIELIKMGNIEALLKLEIDWLTKLIYAETIEDINAILDIVPNNLKSELIRLVDSVKDKNINYKYVLSPLYYAKMKYYNGLFFRVTKGNLLVARGGNYKSGDFNSTGFAFYTDNLIDIFLKEEDSK